MIDCLSPPPLGDSTGHETTWKWSTADLATDILFCFASMPRFTFHTRRIWWGCWCSHQRPNPCHRLYRFLWLPVASKPALDLTRLINKTLISTICGYQFNISWKLSTLVLPISTICGYHFNISWKLSTLILQ